MDKRLQLLALDHNLVFTRYSDDLTFSSSREFDRLAAATIVNEVCRAIRECHFVLHYKKTRVIAPGARLVVLGLTVDRDHVGLLPDFKRRVRLHIRGVSKFGLGAHAASRNFDSVLSFVNHIDGCISFAMGVDRLWAEKAVGEWTAALSLSKYPIS